MKYQTFKVKALGLFPLDMLRYDSCHPATELDSSLISRNLDAHGVGGVEVTVARWVYGKYDQPTVARWASFGCSVSDVVTVKR